MDKEKLNLEAISSEKDEIKELSSVDEKSLAEEKLVESIGRYEKKKHDETVVIKDVAGASGGALLGASIGGPLGALIGGTVGYFLSYSVNHDKED